MSDNDPVDWNMLAELLSKLVGGNKEFSQFIRHAERAADTEINEPELSEAPGSPLSPAAGSLQHVSIVQSVNSTLRQIVVKHALPTTSAQTPWAVDPNSGLYTVTCPLNVSLPAVGDATLATFTGVTSQGASYGLFGASGGAQQFMLKSVHADMLICRTLDTSLVQGTEDVYLAKPFKFRKTPFHGLTLYGLTYSYSSSVTVRDATTSVGSVEQHWIVPAYRNDFDIIYGIPALTSVPNSAGGFCAYLDLNVDGRGWSAP